MTRTSFHSSLVARTLSGSWRNRPAELKITLEELQEVTPLLLGSGAGALAWWRIRNTVFHESSVAKALHEAYRLHSIHASIYQHKIKRAFALLRSAGIEPVLIKGLACARLYPEVGLRPYGDLDLCVAPEQYAAAKTLLGTEEGKSLWVDLHPGLGGCDDRNWQDVFGRSGLIPLDDENVRVLGAEDHLRLLCIHMLKHGAWRPIWLCDIAAALESVDSKFDWDYCKGQDKLRANWVICSIGLARELLGAQVADVSIAKASEGLPRWLIPTVLKQWEKPCTNENSPPELIMFSLRHPTHIPWALIARWPNPIEATIRINGTFTEMPRLPFQIGNYFMQTARFLTRLPRLMQEQ